MRHSEKLALMMKIIERQPFLSDRYSHSERVFKSFCSLFVIPMICNGILLTFLTMKPTELKK